jgi:hypothetical protein
MTGDHDWMRDVLTWLFTSIDVDVAREAVLSDSSRAILRDRINREQGVQGREFLVPDGARGDNLFQGLLALRMKFDQATAAAKLEKNLAMRASTDNRN